MKTNIDNEDAATPDEKEAFMGSSWMMGNFVTTLPVTVVVVIIFFAAASGYFFFNIPISTIIYEVVALIVFAIALYTVFVIGNKKDINEAIEKSQDDD